MSTHPDHAIKAAESEGTPGVMTDHELSERIEDLRAFAHPRVEKLPLIDEDGWLKTADRVRCPKCGVESRANVSESRFFNDDMLALRCGVRECRHIWKVPFSILTREQADHLHRPSLTTLMNRHGTDKLWAHHYDGEYARHFEPIRYSPLHILEIGVGGYGVHGRGGESLRVWRDYFPHAEIIGLDIEDKTHCDSDRITTYQGSQTEPSVLRDLNGLAGPFDIVIDDGSHRQDHIVTAFETLFPLLNPGGIYVIEDMETAYREDYGGDGDPLWNESPAWPNAMVLIASLMDGLHWHFWKGRSSSCGPSECDRLVKSVHVSRELAFIYRQ